MEEATGLSCSVRPLHSPLTFAFGLPLKNRQTKPTGRTCSDSNLLAMQVFITFAEVTGGGAKGRACDDNNPHSLERRLNLPTYRWRVAHSVTVTYGPLCMFLWLY